MKEEGIEFEFGDGWAGLMAEKLIESGWKKGGGSVGI